MVRHAADLQQNTPLTAEDSSNVVVERLFEVLVDQGDAFLGGKDDVVEEIGEAAGHGLVWLSEVRWAGDFFLDGDPAAKDDVCRQQAAGTYRRHSGAAAAPSGLGVVVAFIPGAHAPGFTMPPLRGWAHGLLWRTSGGEGAISGQAGGGGRSVVVVPDELSGQLPRQPLDLGLCPVQG